MNTDHTAAYDQLLPTVQAHFHDTPGDLTEINAGGNNRLLRFTAGGRQFLAKFYPHDGRQRLEREFMAIQFFSSRGLPVPQAFAANAEHRFAIYSLEPGHTKPADQLTRSEVERIADFILALHAIPSAEVPPEFLAADGVFRSYQDYIKLMNARMQIFTSTLTEGRLHPRAEEFAHQTNVIQLVQDLCHQAVAHLSPAAVHEQLPQDLMRLTPIDMGPHNALFSDTGTCFIDFEFTGWDEPMRTIVEITNHQANRGMDPALRQHLRDYYLAHTTLPEQVTSRWPTDDRLMAIIWLTTQLQRLTPERIKWLKFAHPTFDLDAHITVTIAKAQARIQELTN